MAFAHQTGIVEDVLTFTDPLPHRPTRVVIAGVSGVGKTSLAARVSQILGIPATEIDSLFHGPGWVARPTFLEDVQTLIAQDSWVTEWQYSRVQPLLAERAELLIWLDLPYLTVTLPRVIRRTISRSLHKEELWNGNVEAPLHTFFTNRDHIVRWAWSTRKKYRKLVPELESEGTHLTIVRLRSRNEVERWLAQQLIPAADGGSPAE